MSKQRVQMARRVDKSKENYDYVSDVVQEPDERFKVQLKYPYNDYFDYQTYIERIDLDKERIEDIKSGRGFAIRSNLSIKKDIDRQDGIFSSRFGATMNDADSFIDRYSCSCGFLKGTVNHGLVCPVCNTIVKYVDDDVSIFGWLVLKEKYTVIHPNLFRTLESFIGPTRLEHIIKPEVNMDQNGKEIKKEVYKKDEIYKGIGLLELRDKFDEIMNYYLGKYPNKKLYYDDLMANKDILFVHSIPVFSALLRPSKLDNTGALKYEKTNENYQMMVKLVYDCNRDNLGIYRKKKDKLKILYDIQTQFNNVYKELKDILSGKKGDLRSALGGRYDFSGRSVIIQGTDLKPYQIRLPYHTLCEMLQQVIINILVKTYNYSYSDAYKRWYKSQISEDKIVYDIIDNLIKDSDGGLPIIINRNPTIQLGSILMVRCIGINRDFVMSIPLQILKPLAADFDGDTLNILLLLNKHFIEECEKHFSPKSFFISRNDGLLNSDLLFARDTIINANSLKFLYEYNDEQIAKIKRLQSINM